jgi:hypothetical protein
VTPPRPRPAAQHHSATDQLSGELFGVRDGGDKSYAPVEQEAAFHPQVFDPQPVPAPAPVAYPGAVMALMQMMRGSAQ